MEAAHGLALDGGVEQLAGVLADRLEHREPRLSGRTVQRTDEALVDERGQGEQDVDAASAADGFRCLERHQPEKTARRASSFITVEHPVWKDPEIICRQVFGGLLVPPWNCIPRLRAANRTELPNMARIRLDRVRVVIQLAIQSGMHAGQVVAFEIVIHVSLPVAFHLVGASFEQLHAGKTKTLRLIGKVSETFQQWFGLGIKVDEDKIGPLFGPHRSQRKFFGIEAGLAFEFRRADQRPVQPIGPSVIAAAKQLA